MTDFAGSNTAPEFRDLWQTPPEIFAALNQEFNFTLDAAASQYNHLCPDFIDEQTDALTVPWNTAGSIWLNPPYSSILPWVRKSLEAAVSGHTVVMLIPSDTSVGWFRWIRETCSEVRIITDGRLAFVHAESGRRQTGNNKGSMLVIWRYGEIGRCRISFIEREKLMSIGSELISKDKAA
ncbi:phage N-6-adenine-methyltransferase [Pragia fontium]|uniref:phage N-6-adenine-methyltransferase n=1 Tax=Pragia fontium TaxID=82985 RepID=UPI000F6EB249|nr:phage N-6-adenine-methyltransferase [Pragia fontium]VEJ54578.1 phage N-6-adenine-methyltransferase [Pragia fontium]